MKQIAFKLTKPVKQIEVKQNVFIPKLDLSKIVRESQDPYNTNSRRQATEYLKFEEEEDLVLVQSYEISSRCSYREDSSILTEEAMADHTTITHDNVAQTLNKILKEQKRSTLSPTKVQIQEIDELPAFNEIAEVKVISNLNQSLISIDDDLKSKSLSFNITGSNTSNTVSMHLFKNYRLNHEKLHSKSNSFGTVIVSGSNLRGIKSNSPSKITTYRERSEKIDSTCQEKSEESNESYEYLVKKHK